MSQRSSYWSVTINNPTQADEYNIASARQRGWKVEGQLEQGENGTPHYQLLLQTGQVRFSLVKKAFPRAHIEVAKNVSALKKYVQKEDTRVASLSIDQSLYPSQLQLFQWYSSYHIQVKKEYPNQTNLEIFDLMVSQKIRQGYYIGAEVMNPQIRAYIKKFGDSIAHREKSRKDSLDRQTDRQARLNSQEVNITQYGTEENAQIQEETSDPPSSDDERPQEGQQVWRCQVYQGDD